MSDTKASPLPGVVAWAVEMAPHMERTTGPLSNHDAKRLARAVIALDADFRNWRLRCLNDHMTHAECEESETDLMRGHEQRTAEAIAAWLDARAELHPNDTAYSALVHAATALRAGAWRPTPAPPSREEK